MKALACLQGGSYTIPTVNKGCRDPGKDCYQQQQQGVQQQADMQAVIGEEERLKRFCEAVTCAGNIRMPSKVLITSILLVY